MKYFLHDTSSFDDEKITELFTAFGYEGLGLFYTILEKIGKQEKPIKTSVLKTQLKVKKRLEKCWEFMEEIGLINKLNGDTFNERILSYSEMYQIKKQKTREKVSQWRENQEDKKSVTGYVPHCNHPKVKESKVNNIYIHTEEKKYVEKNEKIWDTMPKNDIDLPLPENYIKSAIEQVKITKNFLLAEEKVTGMYAVFKTQNLTGKKFYQSEKEVYSHFLNWLKTQNFLNGQSSNGQYKSKSNSRSAGVEGSLADLTEILNARGIPNL